MVSMQMMLRCRVSLFEQMLSYAYSRDINNLVLNSGIQGESVKHRELGMGNDSCLWLPFHTSITHFSICNRPAHFSQGHSSGEPYGAYDIYSLGRSGGSLD